MLRQILLLTLLALTATATPLLAAQLFVNAEGTAQYATIQDALNAAAGGDEIVLADGVYTGPGNRRLQFYADVILTGSGTYRDCVIDCEGSAADPQYGFALTEETGGTIRNLTVRNAWWTSGAVAQTGWGEYRFEACRFEYNTATSHGGVLYAMDLTDVTFTDCVFYRNSAAGDGGGVWATQDATVQVEGCSMVLNGAARGACLAARDGATIAAVNSLLAWSWEGWAADDDESSGSLSFDCCDLYGNRGGDWTMGASQASGSGNFAVDPLLIDPMVGSDGLYLTRNSPISSAANACGQIGAFTRLYSLQAFHGVDADGTGMYATVREALADLPAGSEIVLEDGTYTGSGVRGLYAYQSSLTIRSRSDDAETCVIDLSDQYGATFLNYMADGGSSALRGLTFHSLPEEGSPAEIIYRHGAQDLLVSNCRFVDSEYGEQGMILIQNSGEFSLVECEFTGNFSDDYTGEGLIRVLGDETTRTEPVTITTCSFRDNTSLRNGSVMSIESRTVLIDDCLFDGNSAGQGGYSDGNTAMLVSCDVDLRNSQFSNNVCKASGNLLLGGCDGLLENVTFEANETVMSGGGVCISGGDLIVRQCKFFGNVAGTSGGGVLVGDGSAAAPQAAVEFDSCLFLDNRSEWYGSGIHVLAQAIGIPGETTPDAIVDATLRQCTFHRNESTQGRAQVDVEETGLLATAEASLSVDYTLITNSNEGRGIDASDVHYLAMTGCNVDGNRGGNYVGQAEPLLAEEGNYSEIPYYCSLDHRYLPVNEISICNPENNILATQIGYFGVGCYGVSGVDDAPAAAAFDRLQGNYPNPFNPATTLSFELAQAGPMTLQIVDVKGRLVRTLVAGGMYEAGTHSVRWDGRDESRGMAAAGLYFARMITHEGEQTHKMVLLK